MGTTEHNGSAEATPQGAARGRLPPEQRPPRRPTLRDWARAHDRRVRAACVARRLVPAAVRLGGYASSRLRVMLPDQPERRPAAALVEGEPPVDGVARVAPLLVVEFAPAAPAWWLLAGTQEVWVLERAAAVVHRRGAAPASFGPGDLLPVLGLADLRVSVAELLGGKPGRRGVRRAGRG